MEPTANAMPSATLGQYKGLPITRRVRPVTEKSVEQELRRLARAHAPFAPVEQPAARGMRVTLDFEGFLSGEPIPDSKMENVTVLLGTGELMPAAEQAVYGHKAGETFRFDFTYPAEFRVPELSGQTAQFQITLHRVEQQQAPAVDDALAKELGFDSLDALLDMAGSNLTVALPGAVLDQNAERDMQQLQRKLDRSKFTLELYCQVNGTTPDQLRANFRRDAERRMRSVLAARAIAEAEHITVSNEEADAEYARLSKLHGTPEAEIRQVLTREAIASAVTTQQVQRFLIAHADITSDVEGE